MKKTTIFLARHGQTEWNVEDRIQGHKNSSLTQLGKEQSAQTKKQLAPYALHKAYVSPLPRAIDTCAIILKGRHIDIEHSDSLKEICLGSWEGKLRSEIKSADPQEYARCWIRGQDQFALAGAESYKQVQLRMVHKLNDIFAKEPGKNILVVSHWLAIKTVIAYYQGISLSQLGEVADLPNASFIVLEHCQNETSSTVSIL